MLHIYRYALSSIAHYFSPYSHLIHYTEETVFIKNQVPNPFLLMIFVFSGKQPVA